MEEKTVTYHDLNDFCAFLALEEKSKATIEKYRRDVKAFIEYAYNIPITKVLVVEYKRHLEANKYAIRSINSMLASVNSFLKFISLPDCVVKSLRVQKQTYCSESKELTKSEYMRLLSAANNNDQLSLILQTICSTGIRVSELKYFTVEAIKNGEIEIRLKGKIRTILVPSSLRKRLLTFALKKRIGKGCIFITRNGNPLDRSNIWSQMKKLYQKAHVAASKVFPHNLRKLFARTFYTIEKDIAKLADILGHSNIETTRIYIMTTCTEHRRKIEKLGLVI
ncbi:MAG: integrase [Erysipelotrichaceae bacterium]|nr:integrase [Erysipelotrichaceae bacterium]